MTILRRVARPLLASVFVTAGVDTIRNPGPRVPIAEEVAAPVTQRLPGMDEHDTEQLVRINGGVQFVAGTMLALGRLPRLSSLALAATLLPTTAAAHKFWEFDDPAQRKQQQIHFFKNLSLFGGLLLASADTEGRPGLVWRARHRAEHAGAAVRRSRGEARRSAKATRERLPV
ncbi:MAG: DoxX family membrane protein [Nitriliruptorales bacterium]|nr:DoxX family membrane protein [Nitriliruptorales bacterium]